VPIGAIRGELAIQMVRGNWQSMTTAGNQSPMLARTNTWAGFAHQSSDLVSTTRTAHGRQLGLDSAMAIDPIHLVVDAADLLAQMPTRHLSRRGGCCRHRNRCWMPETAGTSVLRDGDRPTLRWPKLHFVGCEKMASAFLVHRAP